MTRRLPAALAIGLPRKVGLLLEPQGAHTWSCDLWDRTDSTLLVHGLPVRVMVASGRRTEIAYTVTATRRGEVVFAPTDARVRSHFGLCELIEPLGARQKRRVYPDFAQIARYVWLAGDRRLGEIGIKTYQRRGEGTDFKQLSEYRAGDPVRHLDWKATRDPDHQFPR